MDVIEAIENRFSSREYTSQPVPYELLEKLIKSAWHAPVSCNLQLMHYVIVDNSELLEKLAKITTAKVRWAPVNIFFFIDDRFTKKRNSAIMGLGAAMQNMSLTAVSYGLATCPMAGFENDEKLKLTLKVPKGLKPVLIMGVGYPALKQKRRVRIPVEETLHHNYFNNNTIFLNDSPDLSRWTISEIKDYRRRISPVYRYGERFSLHTYSDAVYSTAVNLSSSYFKSGNVKHVDLFSYDGVFCFEINKSYKLEHTTIADYDPYCLEENRKINGVISTCLIDDDNLLKIPDQSKNLITAIHKLQFTPDKKTLFQECYRVLQKDGVLFVTIDQELWLKNLFGYLGREYKRIKNNEVYNVYENNKYYKIGPYEYIPYFKTDYYARIAGFKKIESGIVEVEQQGTMKHRMYYAAYGK